MKKLKFALCTMLVLFGGLIFAACDSSELTTFDSNLIKVTKAETVYDGNSHIFEVEYSNVDLDITYSVDKVVYKSADQFNFKNAGTYNLYYKISAEGYETYASSEPVQMKITPRTATIKVGDTVICKTDAVTEISPEYTVEGLVSGESISVNFEIGKNANSGVDYDAQTVIYGQKYNYDITYSSSENYNVQIASDNGHVLVKDYFGVTTGAIETYVTTLEDAYAIVGENSVITLYKDFVSADETYLGDIRLTSSDRDYKFTIDLNGHVIEQELDFVNYINPTSNYEYGIDVTIVDSSKGKTGVIGGELEDLWYGILVKGDSKIKVTLQGIKAVGYYGGIYTNGYCKDVKIVADKCEFVGVGEESTGAYLAGEGNYDISDCKFSGLTAYYTKSGTHILTSCKFYATGVYRDPSYNGNGSYVTGSALVVDSAKGYTQPIRVSINSGLFSSVNGYCIEEFSTAKPNDDKVNDVEIKVKGVVNFESYNLAEYSSENDKIEVLQ